ncbi:WXG100 family type VII secretion target [Streptomyces sp. DH37]|uniref:WXG100 family type VII secretion target n=1 Tax=Streptomyces sp. DH37 TaxID=3040122 RepID=UPI002441346A|nr:WXG100 family type VII secretion target [Streptomyces sp. DH37]MDG9706293.1 WXG100 family type VII secretion target [Streptomyces sp. DH37]
MSEYTDGYIHVDYNHSNNAAENLRQQTVAIANTLNQLEMELTALKSSWVGDGADEYTKRQAEWNGAVEAMRQIIDKDSRLLDQIVDDMRHTDNAVTMGWQQVGLRR